METLAFLIGIALAIATIFITYYKRQYSYWKNRNIEYVEPSFPFGNLEAPYKVTETIGLRVKKFYDEIKSRHVPHGGIFFMGRPLYLPIDLECIKSILTKDFDHFVDRGFYYNEKDDPISAHLFAIGGQKWRNLRVKLTPTFTSGKMKMMFQTLLDCEKNLQQKLVKLHELKHPIDIKELLGCYTTDIIGSCAFGLECNTFQDDDSPFRKYGMKFVNASLWRNFLGAFSASFPDLARALKVRAMSKDVSDFFTKMVKDTVEYRDRSNYTRKDFMQLLIDLRDNELAKEEGYKHDGRTLTIDEITAQSFIFFIAGFETSSTTMTWCLYELARNQEVQQKVRDEIKEVLKKYKGEVTYDAIQEMKYMNQVLNETLRKYPPVPFITRECVKDYKVPGKDLTIEKGMQVMVSILGIHHDEEYYPDPEKFDPERFNEENSKGRDQYAHIPFGEGPRICIGLRFGLMQSKVGLTSLLQKFRFTLNEKTKQPVNFSVGNFVLAADGDIWLDAEKI